MKRQEEEEEEEDERNKGEKEKVSRGGHMGGHGNISIQTVISSSIPTLSSLKSCFFVRILNFQCIHTTEKKIINK